MKKLLFTLVLGLMSFVLCPSSLHGQTIPPPYINYQAVLYDVNGPNPNSPLINQSFSTFVNINDELGNLLYREEHYASTDANGLITVKMGDGLYTAGPITNFNAINWGVGKYYLVVDFDINGTISSTAPEQLVTVPYSFYAGKAGNGMTAVADNGNGTLTFTYANGATYTTPTLSGIQGPAGPVGPSGASGTAGQSAYDLWLGQGNTGTVQDFLNTLVGPSGATGPAGVQGATGLTGATGPQGPNGLTGAIGPAGATGPQGAIGPAGTYSAGTGITISNDVISINPSQLPQASQGVRIGFSNSTTWTCPAGVSQITIELWGGGGGGGGGCGNCNNTVCVQSFTRGRAGGNGGSGGYIKANINVVPGTSYSIQVGNGGSGGAAGNTFYTGCNAGGTGGSGGNTSFNGIVVANGGTGGEGAVALTGNCSNAANGTNASIINYNYPVDNSSPLPGYIPTSYLTSYPQSAAGAGLGGQWGTGSGPQAPQPGSNGSKGYCIIIF